MARKLIYIPQRNTTFCLVSFLVKKNNKKTPQPTSPLTVDDPQILNQIIVILVF